MSREADPLDCGELGYLPDHHREPISHFDFDAVERELGEVPPAYRPRKQEVTAAASDAIHELLFFLIRKGRGGPVNAEATGRKVISLAFVLSHPALNGESLSSIARKLGVTRQALSKSGTEITWRWGLHGRAQKRVSSWEIFRRAQSGERHWRHRHQESAT